MVQLFGWGPAFGCHSPSPYVMKSMMQLDMLGVAYTTHIADLEEAPYQKAPYVKVDGKIVADSAFIRRYFENKLGKDLDEGLSKAERATAWALERMVESEIGLMLLHERWLKDENFERGPAIFFADIPEEMRAPIVEDVLGKLAMRVDMQGLSRFPESDRVILFENAVRALSDFLDDKEYMFGDRLTAVDATTYSFVHSCMSDIFVSPMRDVILGYDNLIAYEKRVGQRCFSTNKWNIAA